MCCSALLVARAAKAEEHYETVELSWVRAEGAESCPDASSLRAGVSRRLGRDPFGADPVLSIEVVATRSDAGFRAVIYARRGGAAVGTRSLESSASSCASLADAVALAVALVVDPDAVARKAAVAARTPPPPPPTPIVATAVATASSASPPSASALVSRVPPRLGHRPARPEDRHVTVSSAAVIAFGLLPGTAFGAAFDGRVPLADAFDLSAGLAYFPERTAHVAFGRFGFGLASARLGVCALPLRATHVGVALCARGWLGSIHSVVYQLQPTQPGDRLWAAASAGAELLVRPVRPFEVHLGFDAAVPFTAYRFSVRGQSTAAFAQAQVAGSAHLGVGATF